MSDGDRQASPLAAEPALFNRTYDEALALVVEARGYLAQGRPPRTSPGDLDGAIAYSVESMRLTSRLTHVMAWLMAVRAVHEGELSHDEISDSTWRLGGREVCLGEPSCGPEDLPADLTDLLARSEALYRRVARLDNTLGRH